MDPRTRLFVGAGILALVAAFGVLLFMRSAPAPEEDGLQLLIREFMQTLPESTTEAQREEIRGILARFHDRAVTDEIDPMARIEIENDMIAYIRTGGVPESELFDFMSKVGAATRREDPGDGGPEPAEG